MLFLVIGERRGAENAFLLILDHLLHFRVLEQRGPRPQSELCQVDEAGARELKSESILVPLGHLTEMDGIFVALVHSTQTAGQHSGETQGKGRCQGGSFPKNCGEE